MRNFSTWASISGAVALTVLSSPASACMSLSPELLFAKDATAIEPDSDNAAMLSTFASSYLSGRSSREVRIVGLFDIADGPAAGMSLALQRSTQVQYYLAARGLPYDRLRITLVGEDYSKSPTRKGLVRVVEEEPAMGAVPANGPVPTC